MPTTIDDVLDYAFDIGGIPPECDQFKLPPIEFIERFVYDPERNERLTLEPEQSSVIEQMTRRDENGHFLYDMLVYSAPKKSGKTTLTAGLVLWQAWQVDRGYCYIIGNDLKQADSRMFRVIEYAVKHDTDLKRFCDVNRYKIVLANGTVIEAVPVDPAGEAGSNPTCIAFTECWGMKNNKHNLMWAEMALSPTRPGEGFTLVESYAGHEGESVILENLYDTGVKNGAEIGQELYVHGKQITYWSTRRDLPWQVNNPDYYASEAAKLPASEYRRLHHNDWISSVNTFVAPELWDACLFTDASGKPCALPSLEPTERIVVALDAGVTNDCFAAVGVSRRDGTVYVRYVRVWQPLNNIPLDFDTIEKELYNDLGGMNVVCVVYDKYQIHQMSQHLAKTLGIWFQEFEQGARRLVADKDLQGAIQKQLIRHDGNPVLREHVLNANAKTDNERLRIVKRSDAKKIDAAVALSMARDQAHFLLIG